MVADIDREMEKLKERYAYEIVLVNDCSPDATFEAIRRLCQEKPYITGVNLARNFGQHAALMAGFRQIKGELLVCLDDDGQTPASAIGDLLQGLEEGSDVVYAKYEHKHHNAFRNFGSRINDWMLCFMLGKPKDLYISSFFAAKRFIVDEMLRYQNAFPYVIGLVLRATKNIKNVTVEHHTRSRVGLHAGKAVFPLVQRIYLLQREAAPHRHHGGRGLCGPGLSLRGVHHHQEAGEPSGSRGLQRPDVGHRVHRRDADADAGTDRGVCGKNVYLHEQCARSM